METIALTTLGLVTLSTSAAFAGDDLPSVAIVAAATNTANAQAEPRFTDPRDKLMATGLFSAVDIINATGIGDGVGTPPLETLLEYDAVLTWSNTSFDDAVSMGDVLADYVDAGGGVVVGVFANTSTNPARFLQGRWLSDPGYIAIPQNGGFVDGSAAGLGEVLIADHPILDGVDSFFNQAPMGSNGIPFGAWRPAELSLTEGSTLVARWTTGETLIAIAPNPRVVELGFHPVSNAVNAGYWDQTTDGGLIMANALLFAASQGDEVCPGDVTGDDTVDLADLNLVLANFGSETSEGDTNGDGIVDLADLNAVLAEFGSTC
ncbi:MAG: hypothetical protein ACIAQF_05330 [Phycisphaerales bacterium JB065]